MKLIDLKEQKVRNQVFGGKASDKEKGHESSFDANNTDQER